jgi:hypothetical protein
VRAAAPDHLSGAAYFMSVENGIAWTETACFRDISVIFFFIFLKFCEKNIRNLPPFSGKIKTDMWPETVLLDCKGR